ASQGGFSSKAGPRQSAGLAQLVEHLICNQGVGGSSPSAGTNKISHLNCRHRALRRYVCTNVSSRQRSNLGDTKASARVGAAADASNRTTGAFSLTTAQ